MYSWKEISQTNGNITNRSRGTQHKTAAPLSLSVEEEGLLGGTHFSLDGLKLSSNAAKEWSGTKKELEKKKKKMEKVIRQMVKRHREVDEREADRGVPELFRGRFTVRNRGHNIYSCLQEIDGTTKLLLEGNPFVSERRVGRRQC